MKKVIFIIVIAASMFGCKEKDKSGGTTKVEDKPKIEKKEMNYEQVIAIIGIEAASKLVPANEAAKGGKPSKTVIVVWFGDMTLTQSGNVYTTTLPANTQWAGVQKLAPPIQSLCNWYMPQGSSISCTTDSTGSIRAWATDTDYNVHVSNVIN